MTKRNLLAWCLIVLLLSSCKGGEFTLRSSTLRPVSLTEDGKTSTYLSLYLSLSGEAKDQMDFVVTGPSSFSWSFSSTGTTLDGVTYWGSSRLSAPRLVSGDYQVKVMRGDGKTVEDTVTLYLSGEAPTLPAITRDKGIISWDDGSSLTWRAYDSKDNLLSEGYGESPLTVPANAKSVIVSQEQESTGWIAAVSL